MSLSSVHKKMAQQEKPMSTEKAIFYVVIFVLGVGLSVWFAYQAYLNYIGIQEAEREMEAAKSEAAIAEREFQEAQRELGQRAIITSWTPALTVR